MKKLIFLLAIAFSLCSCYVNRWPKQAASPSTSVESSSQTVKSEKLYTDGKLIYNVSGVIVGKGLTKKGEYIFYVDLEINKQIRWVTTKANFIKKDIGDTVFYDYLSTDRLR